jgi:HPt (histidine-containing phosphotransfer) domain-containing protein
MDDFLVKPFDELQIGEMLRQWIPAHERAPREKPAPCAQPPLAAPSSVAEKADLVIDMDAVNRIRAIPGKGGKSLFERVVSQFTDTAPSLAAAIRAQYESDDADALWRTAHSLKSSAAALGAARLSRRCAQIEALAVNAGTEPVGYLLDALEAELTAAQEGLRELIEIEHV